MGLVHGGLPAKAQCPVRHKIGMWTYAVPLKIEVKIQSVRFGACANQVIRYF